VETVNWGMQAVNYALGNQEKFAAASPRADIVIPEFIDPEESG
jgi:hypothetical protein